MTVPEVVISPIESPVLEPKLVNHRAPSGPAVIPVGSLMRLLPKLLHWWSEVVISPIEPPGLDGSPPALVNHSACCPFGPAVIPNGSLVPAHE